MKISKQELLDTLKLKLNIRLKMYSQAMLDAKTSSQNETKSSAGDKYETTRSMSQMEFGMQQTQFQKTEYDLLFLEQIKSSVNKKVQLGSAAITNNGNYYIAISYGKIVTNDIEFTVISAQSPLAKSLHDKCKNDSFIMNGQSIKILDVF
jgi:hypothetical protein